MTWPTFSSSVMRRRRACTRCSIALSAASGQRGLGQIEALVMGVRAAAVAAGAATAVDVAGGSSAVGAAAGTAVIITPRRRTSGRKRRENKRLTASLDIGTFPLRMTAIVILAPDRTSGGALSPGADYHSRVECGLNGTGADGVDESAGGCGTWR